MLLDPKHSGGNDAAMSEQNMNAYLADVNDPKTGLIHLDGILQDARRSCKIRKRIKASELHQIEDVIAAKRKRLIKENEMIPNVKKVQGKLF